MYLCCKVLGPTWGKGCAGVPETPKLWEQPKIIILGFINLLKTDYHRLSSIWQHKYMQDKVLAIGNLHYYLKERIQRKKYIYKDLLC